MSEKCQLRESSTLLDQNTVCAKPIAPSLLNSLLMRDEYGHGHRGQYAARRTAKHEFA
jgi:hypothetical protein